MPIDLTRYNTAWKQAEPADAGTDRLPDGAYQTIIERVEDTQTKNGRPCILWTLRITGPRLVNRKHWHRDYLDRPETFAFLKRNLALFAIQLEQFTDLPQHYATLTGRAVEIVLRTRNDYQATYFQRALAPATPGAAGPAEGGLAGTAGIAGLSPF